MIKIITDSGCDLSPELIAEHNITVIPIPVQIGGKWYKDGVDITNEEFYRLVRTEKENPTTAAISPYEFEKVFREIEKNGEEAVYISFSSKLSAIHNTVLSVKNTINFQGVDIVDSKCASLGQGLVVLEAARLAREGNSRQGIVEKISAMRDRMEHIFAVGSLEMLKRGGRITGKQAFIGSILNVKPILQFEDGSIIPFDKVRGNKKVISFLIDTMKERGKNLEEQILGISHADNWEFAESLAASIREQCKVKNIIITEIGAAIGSHAGPDTLALFFQG
jgi:DegV family protein with EDD domain